MSAVYLYGVVAAGKELALNVEGVAGDVRLLTEGGLAAIVGAPPSRSLRELNREQALRLLVTHQQVLETAMAQATVLPVKFGVAAPDVDAVRRMLRRGAELLLARLDEFAGQQQYEVVVTWDLGRVFAEIAAMPDMIKARQTAEAAAQNGSAQAAQLEFGHKVKIALEHRRRETAQRIRDGLAEVALDIAANALADDRMAANFAVLLNKSAGDSLDRVLERLDGEFGGGLKFRCVGPLPPANFATVEVTFPSRQAIEEARQALNVEAAADRNDIVSAYRRLARENHPDVAASPEAGAERMGQLSGAYKLLMAHARTRKPEEEDDAPAVIIDVVRNEAAGAPAAM